MSYRPDNCNRVELGQRSRFRSISITYVYLFRHQTLQSKNLSNTISIQLEEREKKTIWFRSRWSSFPLNVFLICPSIYLWFCILYWTDICIDLYYIILFKKKSDRHDLVRNSQPKQTNNCIMIIIIIITISYTDCSYVCFYCTYAVMYIIIMHTRSFVDDFFLGPILSFIQFFLNILDGFLISLSFSCFFSEFISSSLRLDNKSRKCLVIPYNGYTQTRADWATVFSVRVNADTLLGRKPI